MGYKILLENVKAIPINSGIFQKYLCKRGGKEAFLLGNHFKFSLTIKNIDDEQFQGGILRIFIT